LKKDIKLGLATWGTTDKRCMRTRWWGQNLLLDRRK